MNVTVTTVDVELARKLEPRAPRPDLRLETVRQLNLAGVDAGVICAPVLPEITDAPRDLEALVKAASEAGAKYIFANPLFSETVFGGGVSTVLEEHFPALVDHYKKRYENRAFLPRDTQRLWPLETAGTALRRKRWDRRRVWKKEPRGTCGGSRPAVGSVWLGQ